MDTSFRVLIKNDFKNDMRKAKKRKIERDRDIERQRVREGIKRMREKEGDRRRDSVEEEE